MKKTLHIIICLLTTIQLSAQDTLIFSQKNSVLFSNKYFLYPNTKTFEHKFSTDDGQLWYGKGTYKIEKGKLYLSFGDSEKDIIKYNQIEKIYSKSDTTDTLTIRFFDKKHNPTSGQIKYKGKFHFTDFESGTIKIPKNIFNENPIVKTSIQGNQKILKLTKIEKLDTIKIISYNIRTKYHFESNFYRELKFNKKKLKSDDFYGTTKKRKVIFELKK